MSLNDLTDTSQPDLARDTHASLLRQPRSTATHVPAWKRRLRTPQPTRHPAARARCHAPVSARSRARLRRPSPGSRPTRSRAAAARPGPPHAGPAAGLAAFEQSPEGDRRSERSPCAARCQLRSGARYRHEPSWPQGGEHATSAALGDHCPSRSKVDLRSSRHHLTVQQRGQMSQVERPRTVAIQVLGDQTQTPLDAGPCSRGRMALA